MVPQHRAKLVDVRARLLGRRDLGSAHDLHERDAGAVVVDQRVIGLVDAAATAHVHGLAGVLLEVRALDPDRRATDIESAVDEDRLLVLTHLVVLRHVRVEVVLPGEDRRGRHVEVERLRESQRELDRTLVQHRQRAREPQAHRADVGVRLGAELVGATAEQLRHGRELAVHLEPDDGLVARVGLDRHVRLPACPDPTRTSSRYDATSCATAWSSRPCTRASAGSRSCWCTATRRRSGSGGATSPPLAAAGFEVIAPDLRGFGDSSLAADGYYDVSAYSLDLHALVHDVLGHDRVVVVGGDLGGVVCYDLALRYPDLVAAHVLLQHDRPAATRAARSRRRAARAAARGAADGRLLHPPGHRRRCAHRRARHAGAPAGMGRRHVRAPALGRTGTLQPR